MGIGDKTDPTTDFFDLHRAQCAERADKLRGVPEAAALVAKFDEAITACDAAIAAGRRRVDMTPAVATLPVLKTRYEGLSAKTKTDLANALKVSK